MEKKQIEHILQKLVDQKTLVYVTWSNRNYQWTGVIVNVHSGWRNSRFSVEFPGTLTGLIQSEPPSVLDFEFVGEDRLPYQFQAPADEVETDLIWVLFPRDIRRFQRRSDFRIVPPRGTRLKFTIGADRYSLSVLDIGLGGAQGAGMDDDFKKIRIGQQIKSGVLSIPGETGKTIHVAGLKAVRLIAGDVGKPKRYGFQFTHLADHDAKQLREAVYAIQRGLLRNRSESR